MRRPPADRHELDIFRGMATAAFAGGTELVVKHRGFHSIFFLAFVALPLFAQTAPSAPQPDIAIIATVRAKALRFSDTPSVSVTVQGNVNGQAAAIVSKTDRTNLPDRVQPHVTYRDIGIRLTITSTLPNIEQILDDALGPRSKPAVDPPAQKPPVPDSTNANP